MHVTDDINERLGDGTAHRRARGRVHGRVAMMPSRVDQATRPRARRATTRDALADLSATQLEVELTDLARRLPDAFVSLLLVDTQAKPIDASPRRRVPTPRQRRVIDARQDERQHPGCHARNVLEYDHIHPYTAGGSTTIENLQRLRGHHNQAKSATIGATSRGDHDRAPSDHRRSRLLQV